MMNNTNGRTFSGCAHYQIGYVLNASFNRRDPRAAWFVTVSANAMLAV
jgi:hypothetical protein